MDSNIKNSLLLLLNYVEKEKYKGYDPYDALKSPFFNLPFLKTNKTLRFCFQQVVKRLHFNLRPFLLVPKGYNPVTLGLCIQSYGYLSRIFPENKKEYFSKAEYLISELIKLVPEGFSGACWGYDFDWEARYAKIKAYQPTVVATGIITNGLFEFFKISKNEEALSLCKSACNFILKDLKRTYSGDTFCFSYSPFDEQIVFNASMKGARCLAQVYSVTKKEELISTANKAVEFVVNNQREDGSWIYGNQKTADWVDNYHTGYILDCLSEFLIAEENQKFRKALNKGINYYVNNFFYENKIPKFYDKKLYPIDCTAAGQSLLALPRFNYILMAENVAKFMIENMQDEEGYFYFRNYGNKIAKTSFMRWSNAWMLAGLSYYLFMKEKN
ncbi:MAG: prenyltransferase/squalene oxidase repeat-containing protein [Ignavibacteriaceae bacterium]